MSFEETLRIQFVSFKLNPPNEPHYKRHLFCDFIELMALFTHSDCVVSKNDVFERVYPKIFQEDQPTDFASEEIGDQLGENNDRKQQDIEGYFRELSYRSAFLSDLYPFDVNQTIKLKDELSIIQKHYLYLLICSNLALFKELQSYLTTAFEEFSFYALKKYLPPHAQIRKFGKNTSYCGSPRKLDNLNRCKGLLN